MGELLGFVHNVAHVPWLGPDLYKGEVLFRAKATLR